ncbi:MAG: hypothetical protein H7A23_22010 [Leptospiraceae bacterium]|nr:hypothetical protein [Leptospiraceae bacterium]
MSTSLLSKEEEVRENFYHYIFLSYGMGHGSMSSQTSLGQNIKTYLMSLYPYPTSDLFPVSFQLPMTYPNRMYSEYMKIGGEYRPIRYFGIYYSVAKMNYYVPLSLKTTDLFYINQLKQNTYFFLPVSSLSGSFAKPALGFNIHILGDGIFDLYIGAGVSVIRKYPTGTGRIGIQLNFANNTFLNFQGEGEYTPKLSFLQNTEEEKQETIKMLPIEF